MAYYGEYYTMKKRKGRPSRLKQILNIPSTWVKKFFGFLVKSHSLNPYTYIGDHEFIWFNYWYEPEFTADTLRKANDE